ncbi:hypothetical protein DS2_11738 [Catenovulum agarivorans DS-2]|uniref:DUF4340 domain-containing protein n=1 Tax=Catenovulum agarivorans DS-2 TaxID=1328313 RepID=W7QP12_9ALTE|nr:DUF4340 domain-containing protein [Catenovulum agarivorans]EWH09638.1 hypothetical protein DS2_11738 [Catenovulum agarivorans DS-2]
MTNKTITLLSLTAAIAMAAALFVSQQEQVEQNSQVEHWIQSVLDNKTQLTGVKIYSPENKLVIDAQQANDTWLMANSANYQIDTSKLSKWYNQVIGAKNIEPKTAKPENFELLGLVNPNSIDQSETENANAGHLVILTLAGNEHELVFGNPASSGQFARLASENQTWLLDDYISMPNQASDWINTKLFDFKLDDIQSLQSFSASDPELNWTIERTETEQEGQQEVQEYVLLDTPEERELTYAGVARSHISSIANLNFAKVENFSAEIWQDKESLNKLTVTLVDDKSIEVFIHQAGEQTLLMVDNKQQMQPKWQFALETYQTSLVNKSLSSFLKPLEDDNQQSESE